MTAADRHAREPRPAAGLAAVLARSFADDPMIRWPFHDHDVAERAGPMFLAILTEYQRFGMVWEAGYGSRGGGVDPSRQRRRAGGDERRHAGRDPPLTDDGAVRYHAFWGWLEAHIPDEPHWMLDMVGVDPARQGQGIGSALIRHGLDLAERDGVGDVPRDRQPSERSLLRAPGVPGDRRRRRARRRTAHLVHAAVNAGARSTPTRARLPWSA